MRVRIRGTTFDTVGEAARWAGVSPATIYSAMHRGRMDTVGLGGGRKSAYGYGGGRGGRRKVAVRLWGLRFESIRDAERWLDVKPGYLAQIIRRGGGEGAWARVMALAEARGAEARGARDALEGSAGRAGRAG